MWFFFGSRRLEQRTAGRSRRVSVMSRASISLNVAGDALVIGSQYAGIKYAQVDPRRHDGELGIAGRVHGSVVGCVAVLLQSLLLVLVMIRAA